MRRFLERSTWWSWIAAVVFTVDCDCTSLTTKLANIAKFHRASSVYKTVTTSRRRLSSTSTQPKISSSTSTAPSSVPSSRAQPSAMPTQRSVPSIGSKHPTRDDSAHASFFTNHKWSFVVPVAAGMAIMAWAVKANANVREKAKTAKERAMACCGPEVVQACYGEEIPDEIVVQTKTSNEDMELMSMMKAKKRIVNIARLGRPPVYKPPAWHRFPDDPVDEVSLKGSSFYCSSSSSSEVEDIRDEPTTRFARMEN